MSALSKKLRSLHSGKVGYWCQGCNQMHSVRVDGADAWGFNGNVDLPTFTPSVLVKYDANPDALEEYKEWRTERICHTFICTHEFAGQTLDLPDLPDWLQS